MIPYSKQYIFKKDIKNVGKVLKSKYLTQGPQIEIFEKKLKNRCGSKYAVAVNSATSALHLTCLALGLKKGKYLWTVPISFVASANCGLYCGAKVDFVDIDNQTYNIDLIKLEKKLITAKKTNKLPAVLIPVHLGGNPCNLIGLRRLSKKYNFKIIEDASHALGSKYRGEPIGNCNYSDAVVFSFHPVKSITSGEGGAVLLNDKKIYTKIKMLREHGITKNPKAFKKNNPGAWYFEQQHLGYNYRMSDIHAALAASQLDHLKKFTSTRNKIVKKYLKELSNLKIKFQKIEKNSLSSWHLFIIRVNKKIHKKLFDFLRKKKLYVQIHYIPIYRHPYYLKNFKFKKTQYPNSEKYYSEAISIPVFFDLSKNKQNYIINKIKYFMKNK